jgi:hypothetical protein
MLSRFRLVIAESAGTVDNAGSQRVITVYGEGGILYPRPRLHAKHAKERNLEEEHCTWPARTPGFRGPFFCVIDYLWILCT